MDSPANAETVVATTLPTATPMTVPWTPKNEAMTAARTAPIAEAATWIGLSFIVESGLKACGYLRRIGGGGAAGRVVRTTLWPWSGGQERDPSNLRGPLAPDRFYCADTAHRERIHRAYRSTGSCLLVERQVYFVAMTELATVQAVAHAAPYRADVREGREHGEETRARIIETALELIADHGFASTSTREISERLGFTKAALYYHFRTKEELLAAIMEPVVRDMTALVGSSSDAGTPAERRRVLEGYVDLVAAHADLMKVLANDPAVRRCGVLELARPLYERLERILLGTPDPDLRQSTRARAALGAVLVPLMKAAPEDDAEEVRDAVISAACAVLGLPAGGRRARDARPARDGRAGEGAARSHERVEEVVVR